MTSAEMERTSAYLDGELEGEAAREAERHIETCAECGAFVAAAADLSETLRRPAARWTAPDALRTRIGRGLDAEAGQVSRRPSPRPKPFWLGALSGVGASAIAAALAVVLVLPPSPETLVAALGDAHARALMSGGTVQVRSTSHHTVKPWFAGRIPLSPPVADFAADGFPLTGGRIDSVEGRMAAVVVYAHGAHEIDLFVQPARGSPSAVLADRRGYHVLTWRRGDLDLAAVSDVQPGELARFAQLVRTARE